HVRRSHRAPVADLCARHGAGAAGHPRSRHPASRPQARERDAARRRQHCADRLRPRQTRGAQDGGHRQGADLRHAALHEPGAGARQGDRRTQRHLCARRDALRDAHRQEAVRRREPHGDPRAPRQGADPQTTRAHRVDSAAHRYAHGERPGESARRRGYGCETHGVRAGRARRAGTRGVTGRREMAASAPSLSGQVERATGGDVLRAATPRGWVDAALDDLPTLLVDHANCEKKAASTALALIFAYPEDRTLNVALSRLAREELKHFEQVERLMKKLDIGYQRMKPGRYASELRKLVRTHEPKRKLDLMIVHALIEARSCERFRLLAKRLPEEVRALYEQLERSEARHFEIYLQFAQREFAAAEISTRLEVIAAREAELATQPDRELRFHSGPPR